MNNEEEINIETISWIAPEHIHKDRSIDWYWTVGIITIIALGLAIWTKNYVFGIFIFISGVSLGLISIRHPQEIKFVIDNKGFIIGKYLYKWKKVKSFDIKKDEDDYRLLIEIDKYFLPVYTIHIPNDLVPRIKENLAQVTERKELNESRSVLFMEKLGF